MIVQILEQFWLINVCGGIAPDDFNSEDTLFKHPASNPGETVQEDAQDNQYGNSQFVKVNVGKTNRGKYGIFREDLPQYSPILGNLKSYTGGLAAQEPRPAVEGDDDLPEAESVNAVSMLQNAPYIEETPSVEIDSILLARALRHMALFSDANVLSSGYGL